MKRHEKIILKNFIEIQKDYLIKCNVAICMMHKSGETLITNALTCLFTYLFANL